MALSHVWVFERVCILWQLEISSTVKVSTRVTKAVDVISTPRAESLCAVVVQAGRAIIVRKVSLI